MKTAKSPKAMKPGAKTEFDEAMLTWRHYETLRRADLLLFIGAQGALGNALWGALGPSLTGLDPRGWILALVGLVVALAGLNTERRVSTYMDAYVIRARHIADKHHMPFMAEASKAVENKKRLASNKRAFGAIYIAAMIIWIGILALNVMTIVSKLT